MSSPAYWMAQSQQAPGRGAGRRQGPGWLPNGYAENHAGPSQPCAQGKVGMEPEALRLEHLPSSLST